MDSDKNFGLNPEQQRDYKTGHERAIEMLRAQAELLSVGKPDLEAVAEVVKGIVESVHIDHPSLDMRDIGFLVCIATEALNHSIKTHAQATEEMAEVLNRVWR